MSDGKKGGVEYSGGKVFTDVPVEKLRPYPNNYLDHNANLEAIKASLKRFGMRKGSVLVDEKWELIAGHGVLAAAKALGWTEIPVVCMAVGMPEKDKKALRIADNESARKSVIIPDLLAAEAADLNGYIDLNEFGIDVSDFLAPEPGVGGGGEVDPDDLGGQSCECPRCGFKFNPKEAKKP